MTIDDKRARLAGRRVLITGASSGVGLAATLAFAREGARLALISRNPAAIEPILDFVRYMPVVAFVPLSWLHGFLTTITLAPCAEACRVLLAQAPQDEPRPVALG